MMIKLSSTNTVVVNLDSKVKVRGLMIIMIKIIFSFESSIEQCIRWPNAVVVVLFMSPHL